MELNNHETINLLIRRMVREAKDIHSLNNPAVRELLVNELGLSPKLAGTVIGKAVDLKAIEIKAHKRQCKRHAKLNILESLGKKSLGDGTSKDAAIAHAKKELKEQSTKSLQLRANLRKEIKAGNAKAKDLAKLDLYHGTHYDKVGGGNTLTARGKQKDRGTSQAPKGVKFK